MLYCKWDVWLLFSFSSVYFTSFISLVHVLYAYNGYVANKNIFSLSFQVIQYVANPV